MSSHAFRNRLYRQQPRAGPGRASQRRQDAEVCKYLLSLTLFFDIFCMEYPVRSSWWISGSPFHGNVNKMQVFS